MNEITDNNYVLDDMELVFTCILFEPKERIKISFKRKETKEMLSKIFQKIRKLNDMAKQAKEHNHE